MHACLPHIQHQSALVITSIIRYEKAGDIIPKPVCFFNRNMGIFVRQTVRKASSIKESCFTTNFIVHSPEVGAAEGMSNHYCRYLRS